MNTATKQALEAFSQRVSAEFPVTAFILFGSRARGDFHAESDADVAVFLQGQAGDFVQTKLAMADIAFDTLLATGIRIQPLPVWESEWRHPEQYSNPRLLENIDREGLRF